MLQRLLKIVHTMELEERVFHVGLLLSLLAIFFPWLTSGTYGEAVNWSNGLGYRTGYIGHLVFLSTLYLLFVTVSPATGGPIIVKKSHRHFVRFYMSSAVLLLLLSAFTVLLRITFEVSGIEIRFGIYVALIGSALSSLYSFLIYQEVENSKIRELFHHPDEQKIMRAPTVESEQDFVPPPPPPPPPPLSPEDHHFFSKQL